MKYFLYLAFAFCALFSCISCNDSNDVDVNDINKQTTVVYMPWTGSSSDSGLLYDFMNNLDSIEGAIVNNRGTNGRVLVFLSSSTDSSSLYEIVYQRGQIKHVNIKKYAGHNYTTATGLASILNDAKSYAPALNYAMIVSGHGTGWTYKEDWTSYPTPAKRHVFNAKRRTPLPLTRFYGSVSDNQYAANISTIAEAIGLTGIKMQYILFDDCYMANIETAYELRNVTNFLIASTSEVMSIGMPYQSMWKLLASPTPNYDSAVQAFYNFYKNYTYPFGALTVVDCRKLDQIAARMKFINSRFTFNTALTDSLQVLDGFNTPLFYDMGDYVARLCTNTDLLNDFNKDLKSAIRSTCHTDSVYSHIYLYSPRYIKISRFSGITISDPSTNPVVLRGRTKTAWWNATH